jgi:hypothetical protein
LATLLPRRVVGALSSLLVAGAAVTALAGPAHAEDGYQYWNYFHLENDSWAFSDVGAAEFVPEDGDVEGLRFGTSTPSQGIEPRADLAEVGFDTVCGDTEAAEGEKRVALVVDFGVEEGNGTPPEPRADCAVGDESASTQELLGEVADVRVESGMLCGVDGYPAKGCGEAVPDAEMGGEETTVAFALPTDAADDTSTSDAAADEAEESSSVWPLVVVGLVVVLVAALALALARRSRTA